MGGMTTPETLEEIYRRFRSARDGTALGELFDRTAPTLLRVACHVANDLAAAEDLVQATFLVLLEGKGRFDERRLLLPWLLGVLANQARRARRDGRRFETAAALASLADPRPPLAPEERELAKRVAEAIDTLGEPYRAVARLALCDVLAPAEIALRLGRSAGAVRVQLHRALDQLRRRMAVGAMSLPWLVSRVESLGIGVDGLRERMLRQATAAGAVGVAMLPAVAAWFSRRLVRALAALLLVSGGAWVAWNLRRGVDAPPAVDRAAVASRSAHRADDASPSPEAVRTLAEPSAGGAVASSATPAALPPPPPRGDRVFGVVRDASGAPVADARLEVRGVLDSVDAYVLDGPLLADGQSGADGRFELGPVEPFTPLELVCRTTGFVLDRQWVTAGREAAVELKRGGVLTGRVTDESTGAPIVGLSVAWAFRQRLEPAVPPTLTDRDGRFRFDAVAEETPVELVMTRPGAIEHRHGVTTQRGATDVAASWPATRSMRGRIVTTETRQPIAGAVVRDGLHGDWTVPYVVGTVLAVTDAAGEFVVPGVPAKWFADGQDGSFHELRLIVTAAGRCAMQFTVTPSPEALLELPLPVGLDLVGRVVDEGAEPLAGAAVTDERTRMGYEERDADDGDDDELKPRSYPGYDRAAIQIGVRTDAQGRFAIRGASPSREPRKIMIEHPACGWNQQWLAPDADFAHLELRVARGATIEGTVRVGGEVVEAVVVWREVGGELFRSDHAVVVDGDGRYRLTGLPEGKVELAVAPPGFDGFLQVVAPDFAPPVAREEFTTTAGAVVNHDFALKARRSGLSGRVVGTDGRSIAFAQVCICGSLIDPSPGPIETDYYEEHFRADGDGRFERAIWLPPEADRPELPKVRVIVEHRSVRKLIDDVSLESKDFVVELPVVAPLAVVVTAAADSRPLRRAGFQWRSRGELRWHQLDADALEPVPRTLAAGGATEIDLPLGECELVVWDPDGDVAPARIALSLPRPDSGPLALALPAAASVAIHWIDRSGAPKDDDSVVLLLHEDELPLVRLAAGEFGNLRLPDLEIDVDAPAVPALIEQRVLKLYWEVNVFGGIPPGRWSLRSFGRARRFEPESFVVPVPQSGDPPFGIEIVGS